MEKNKLGFTLVELIVTITILAILGTIGFMSVQNYTVYSRDVVRITSLNNIKSVMEYSMTETGRYPSPDGEVAIKYDGTIVWNQGTFGKTAKIKTKRLDKVPTDPLTENEYTLSVSTNGQEYELGGAYEGDEVANNFINKSYADNSKLKTRLIGNYNGKVKLIEHNNIDYALALPSLVATDLSDTSDDNLENIIYNEKLTYNGYNQLPASYGNTTSSQSGNINITPNHLVAWSGSLDEMKETGSGFTKLSTGLYSAYLGTDLYLGGDEFKYVDSSDVVEYILKSTVEEGNIYKNCKEIQEKTDATTNGCYSVTGIKVSEDDCITAGNDLNQYYCNMEDNGGGWTMYVKIKGNYSFNDSKNCVLGEEINNSELYCTVPFQFGNNKELWYKDLTIGMDYINDIDQKYVYNDSLNIESFFKSVYFDLNYNSSDESKNHTTLGFNLNHRNLICNGGQHPGVRSYYGGKTYLNYNVGYNCSGPYISGSNNPLESNSRKSEFYVR